VDVHVFHIVDDVLTNLDHRMLALHRAKITCAQGVCSSLYEGYAPLAAEEAAFSD
jgi:hypothetical protein